MISFVSFDYFQPGNFVDFGFSEMPSWSERFEWLGYDTINFVEGMGSIIIFAFAQILLSLLSAILECIRYRTGKSWLKNRLGASKVLTSNLAFVHGVFFEVLVCVSISMAMLSYSEFLNDSDWTSVYLSFIFAAILLCYIVFMLYFSCWKSMQMVVLARGNQLEGRE